MNEQITSQKHVYNELKEPISIDVTEAIEQYQTLIGLLLPVYTGLHSLYSQVYSMNHFITIVVTSSQ